MSEETPVTAHVRQCVKLLNEWRAKRGLTLVESAAGYEAMFELIDLPWDEHTEEDGMFREGYETCLLDVIDAIATAWGVSLPQQKVVLG